MRFGSGRHGGGVSYSSEVAVIGTATSGEEALAKAATRRPQVILIDLGTPRMSGLEAISRLKSMFPQTGIIALTELDGEDHTDPRVEE
jgi:DNA-binding NarL/FixJ family response regulator